MLNSTDAVNRGYWDPEESTRTKWTNDSSHGGYADILEERGLTKDFTGLSELLLGQAQPKQFQSYNDDQPQGWWWGSKVSDDGSLTPLSNPTAAQMNNANAEIPRSYHDRQHANAYGDFYNYYSATAESGRYSMASDDALDSLCPHGWGLPSSGSSSNPENKSWTYLFNREEIPIGAEAASYLNALKRTPLFLMNNSYFSQDVGRIQGGSSSFMSSTTSSQYANRLSIGGASMWITGIAKSQGLYVRCILK